MASLFIKDPETAALAHRVAAKLGTTKTEAVRRGLTAIESGETFEAADGGAVTGKTVEWLRQYRAQHPLPDREAMKIDKAFYDSLSDEEDVVDPWSD